MTASHRCHSLSASHTAPCGLLLLLALALLAAPSYASSRHLLADNDTLLTQPYAVTGAPALSAPVQSNATSNTSLPHRMLASCADTNSQCADWSKKGYCASCWFLSGKSVRDVVCPATCGACTPSGGGGSSGGGGNSGGGGGSTGTGLSQTNAYRQKHHAPSMTWDSSIASHAQSWANTLAAGCKFEHGGHDGEGQNLYASGGFQASWSQVIDSWYNEVRSYRFSSKPWTDNSANFGAIGHFTQLVWVGSSHLGCAMATNTRCSGMQYYYVCNYGPPGNYVGDSSFKANVLPA